MSQVNVTDAQSIKQISPSRTSRKIPFDARTIDCLILEYVLGYEIRRIQPDWYPTEVTCFYEPNNPLMAYRYDQNGCNALMYRNGYTQEDGFADPVPCFFTEAPEGKEWEVVRAMQGKHDATMRMLTTVIKYPNSAPVTQYTCTFLALTETGPVRGVAQSKSPAQAICLAALQILGLDLALELQA